MILTFADANRTYDPEHQCVRFAGHGDDFEVSFELETRALRKMDPNAPVDEHSMLAVFEYAPAEGRLASAVMNAPPCGQGPV